MCLIFTDEQERIDSLLKFLLSGLKEGDRSLCLSGKVTEDDLRGYFAKNNISYDERKQSSALSLSDTSEVYFQDNCF